MIYFITQGDEFVKIGRGGDPETRLSQLQIGNPNDLKLWVSFPGGQREEVWLHKYWEKWHVRGEWYRIDDALKSFVHLWVDGGNLVIAMQSDKFIDEYEKRDDVIQLHKEV